MVVPLIVGGLVRASPFIFKFGRKIITSLLPKTTKGKIFAGATLPTIVGFGFTETGRKTISAVFDPRKGFERGQSLGAAKVNGKSPILEGAKKIGLVGAGLGAAAIIGGGIISKIPKPTIPKFKPRKEKVLDQADITKAQPIEGISKDLQEPTLGAVEKPKAAAVQKPMSIKNTFNPSIDIRFSKSRKFINQQVLVRQ